MQNIKVLYIDDKIDTGVSRYLLENFSTEKPITWSFEELEFLPDHHDYELLIEDSQVKDADIIVIDSMLFENDTAGPEKLSGEEFKLILRKVYPYKEVIVITQNDTDPEYRILSKYDSAKHIKDEHAFYETNWKSTIEAAIDAIILYRKILDKLNENSNINSVLIEKIRNSIEGMLAYDELNKSDIDKLVEMFEKVQARYE